MGFLNIAVVDKHGSRIPWQKVNDLVDQKRESNDREQAAIQAAKKRTSAEGA